MWGISTLRRMYIFMFRICFVCAFLFPLWHFAAWCLIRFWQWDVPFLLPLFVFVFAIGTAVFAAFFIVFLYVHFALALCFYWVFYLLSFLALWYVLWECVLLTTLVSLDRCLLPHSWSLSRAPVSCLLLPCSSSGFCSRERVPFPGVLLARFLLRFPWFLSRVPRQVSACSCQCFSRAHYSRDHLLTCFPVCPPTCLFSCLLTFLLVRLPVCPITYLPGSWPTCLLTCCVCMYVRARVCVCERERERER